MLRRHPSAVWSLLRRLFDVVPRLFEALLNVGVLEIADEFVFLAREEDLREEVDLREVVFFLEPAFLAVVLLEVLLLVLFLRVRDVVVFFFELALLVVLRAVFFFEAATLRELFLADERAFFRIAIFFLLLNLECNFAYTFYRYREEKTLEKKLQFLRKKRA